MIQYPLYLAIEALEKQVWPELLQREDRAHLVIKAKHKS
jgi:hypothetical protein